MPTDDELHILSSGYFHTTVGSFGTGPSPYQVCVGFPRNWTIPGTIPHGAPTVSISKASVSGGPEGRDVSSGSTEG